jgi:hypothetical protein
MSTIGSYPTRDFSESQKFLVLNPETQSTSLVSGRDLVEYITPQSTYVFAEQSRAVAQNEDYQIGALIQTAGDLTAGDNFAGTFLVVPGGDGDFPMANGNDLLIIKGDILLREQLASNTPAQGSDRIAHTGTSDTVTQALDKRTIYVGSVAELESLSLAAGVNVYLTEPGREGEGTIKSGTAPTDTLKGRYIVLANGNYWSRNEVRFIDPAWYGADFTGANATDPEWSAAIDEAISSNLAILPRPGTYKKTASTAKDNFTGLYVFGRGKVTIDFQTNDAFKLGDFTQDGDGFYTQTSITCSDIVFSGVKFIPSDNGWNGSNFAYARPLAFSSAQNVRVTDQCEFHDNHVGAVDFSAPCKDIFIQNCHFESSEEASSTYGPRPFCFVAPLDNLDETTGTLAYPAPTVYHENVNINWNTFQQIGRGIVSWNVHGFDYSNNIFRKPTVRTISATNWSFDGAIHHNTHIAEDNTTSTLSTFVNIGVGSERIKVHNEKFLGSLSGTGNNASLKCVDCGGASSGIEVLNNTFNTVGMASAVNVGPNVEITISQRNRFMQDCIGATRSPIVINEGPAPSPGFNLPKTIISDNVDYANNRLVVLHGEPPGTPETVEVFGNEMKVLPVNRVVQANATSSNWAVALWDNKIPLGDFAYVSNVGSGGIQVLRADKFERSMVTINTTGSNVTVNWRDYHGEQWYIVPDVSQTIDDIPGALADGQILTIQSGGTITFPHGGNFRLDGATNAVLGVNDVISFVSRQGIWFETTRSAS